MSVDKDEDVILQAAAVLEVGAVEQSPRAKTFL